jgi:hypothetical protein
VRISFVLALALAASAGPLVAHAASVESAQPNTVWTRKVSGDGMAAVQLPCPDSAIRSGNRNGTYIVVCLGGRISFGLSVGSLPTETGENGDFDDMLAVATAQFGDQRITRADWEGRRGFAITSQDGDRVVRSRVVEMSPGKLIVASAMQSGVEPLKGREAIEARALAQKFVETLEVLAK